MRSKLEKGIGNRATDAFMKEKKEKRGLNPFFREAIAVVWEFPLNQAMGFHLTEIVAELGERIGMRLEPKGFEKRLMEITRSPRGDAGTGMDEHLHETDQAGIVDFDSWDFGMAGDDRESQTLEEGEIHMDLEGLSLKGSEPVGNGEEVGAYR